MGPCCVVGMGDWAGIHRVGFMSRVLIVGCSWELWSRYARDIRAVGVVVLAAFSEGGGGFDREASGCGSEDLFGC